MAMCNQPEALPLVSKIDQKMNGYGFFVQNAQQVLRALILT
jgi:hypothetical protein